MYTEGFESLEEAERESRNGYGNSSDMEKLLRENERLKKSLEKEKLFNKLLDQEIQDLKSGMPAHQQNTPSEYWSGKKGVSRGTFYTLLFITLVMAGYIGYGFYYDKKINYLNIGRNTPGATAAINEPVAGSEPEAGAASGAINQPAASLTPESSLSTPVNPTEANGNAQPANPAKVSTPQPVIKDSVPNIIGNKSPAAPAKQKAAATLTPDEEYDEDEVNAVIEEETTTVRRPAATPPSAQNRKVIGRYRITSKANFYNRPDENTMRSTYIPGSGEKTVNALEDRNGFIFVEYTNDLGFTSKGWLSKKDLTKE